jgi:filamentous hemagglutinin
MVSAAANTKAIFTTPIRSQSNQQQSGGKEHVFGEKGTQVTSQTVGKGKGWRIDVENPNPGKRPGQLHYQSGDTKYLYDPKTKTFIGASKSENKRILSNPEIKKAIEKGLKVLGEEI